MSGIRSGAAARFARLAAVLALLAVLAGCAGQGPRVSPLEPEAAEEAGRALAAMLARPCPDYIDADVSLGWEAVGLASLVSDEHGMVPAQLQMQAPDRLRFSVVDPLGRPLLILVMGGKGFAMVQTVEQVALTGSTASALALYVAPTLRPEDIFPLLQARPFGVTDADAYTPLGRDEQGIWFASVDGLHRLLVDPGAGMLLRHQVLDTKERVLLDLHYSLREPEVPGVCPDVREIRVLGRDGSLEHARITLRFNHYYPPAADSGDLLKLTIPPHFTRRILR